MSKQVFILTLVGFCVPYLLRGQEEFMWPEGKQFAVSISFDDSRPTVLKYGIPLLNRYGVGATFYVHPHMIEASLDEWKAALSSGHEIGNHTSLHPCTENFWWIRQEPYKPLEEYTLKSMEDELLSTNRQIEQLLGVTPISFAYPCGQTQIGRGEGKKSYASVVAKLFTTGRGWLDEAPVDPLYCDLAEITGISMDDIDFEAILPMINEARQRGLWLVLAGHDTQPEHTSQTTRLKFLEDLCEYVSAHGEIWMAPVGEVATYVEKVRTDGRLLHNKPLAVIGDTQGCINLKAALGRAYGPQIEYITDRKAFGNWTDKDTVVWSVRVPTPTTYQIEVEWSVADHEVGKDMKLIVDGEEQVILLGKSDGNGKFRNAVVGTITIRAGEHNLMIMPTNADNRSLTIRAIRLVPQKG
ncbi:hypothetical protein GCM10007415_01530 [Parapedobacter pyrenivorans]|uniref:NodB homology domain-containing protein n=2 Tax=Parapedobacter pyrenivorans TaxID=1305674 RepID=A0A917HBE3_9SPHI|nr:hypothetical protein GCM10007415_01530 [Parapedobacter pyrenivorans]